MFRLMTLSCTRCGNSLHVETVETEPPAGELRCQCPRCNTWFAVPGGNAETAAGFDRVGDPGPTARLSTPRARGGPSRPHGFRPIPPGRPVRSPPGSAPSPPRRDRPSSSRESGSNSRPPATRRGRGGPKSGRRGGRCAPLAQRPRMPNTTLLRLWSSLRNGRNPHRWQAEFTLQVTWWTRKTHSARPR